MDADGGQPQPLRLHPTFTWGGNVMWQEFKEFALRGSAMDMAIGIILGAAFGAVVSSLVSDVLTPPLGLLVANVDFSDLFLVLAAGSPPPPYDTLADAQAAGAITMNVGAFADAVLSFLIVALAVFFVVRVLHRLKRREEMAPAKPTTKKCPFCISAIPLEASRCPQCTSQLAAA